MKAVVFGMGYVGFTAACCIASEGHSVVGIDISDKKVAGINDGRSPIVESKIDDMLIAARKAGRFEAATQVGVHLKDADIAIVCVGTPSAIDGTLNMGFIADVSNQIANTLKANPPERPISVVYRSTMRPGTMDTLVRPIFCAALEDKTVKYVRLIYNPEFLREGSAVDDYFDPPKIVVGTADSKPDPVMEELNQNISTNVFWVGYREAEITKFVDNSWHAVKVAFANEIGRVCLALDVSAQQVHQIFKSDTKLNISPYYTRPGGAFGGSCLPKDVRALQSIGADTGAGLHLIDSLLRSNAAHKHRLFELASQGLDENARILLVGLAFKEGTDDLRESPNVDLVRKLLDVGFTLEIYDPSIRADMLIGTNLGYAYSQLPMLRRLLVSKEQAEKNHYARVIVTNATIKHLNLKDGQEICDINALA